MVPVFIPIYLFYNSYHINFEGGTMQKAVKSKRMHGKIASCYV